MAAHTATNPPMIFELTICAVLFTLTSIVIAGMLHL